MALFFLAITYNMLGQERTCGTMEHLQQEILDNPARQSVLDDIEEHTNLILGGMGRSSVTGVITIPVVVHVVHNTTAENISDAQILSQINVLNQDFRRTNPDANGLWSQAADTEIAFCLATVDPSGNPTTGITRTYTTRTSFSSSGNYMKFNSTGGKDAWPAGSYLNIWVCDLSSGLLGYAQFPGGSASTDGVVCDYAYFGTIGTATAPFNLGRTATHEVGHWLNLRHIWGDGGCSVDDFVSDTPVSDAPNYGCATGHVSCSTVDMVQNYMDYSDDACMNLYTAGQKARMRALFSSGGARASLLTSGGCGSAPPAPSCSDGIQNGTETGVDCGGSCPPCPTGCTTNALNLSITFDNYPEETSWTLRTSAGATVASGGPYGSQPDGSTLNIPLCVPNDCYVFTMFDSYGDGMCCSYGSGSYTLTGPSGTLASGGTFTTSQVTNFCLGTTPPPTCTDGIQNGTETGVDCGGSCPPCPTGCTYTPINSNNFESGLGIWTLGSNARRSSADAAYANGTFCVRLRGNTSTSVMSTSSLNLSAYNRVKIDFSFLTRSFANTSHDFWLQVSTNGGASYSTVVEWDYSTDFLNNVRYNPSVILTGTFGSNCRFRFRCDAGNTSDFVYIDDVVIQACNSPAREGFEDADFIVELDGNMMESHTAVNSLNLYPNPTSDQLNVEFDLMQDGEWVLVVADITGKMVRSESQFRTAGRQVMQLQTSDLASGMYLLYLTDGTERLSRKFSVQR